jgi:hypothetical protein
MRLDGREHTGIAFDAAMEFVEAALMSRRVALAMHPKRQYEDRPAGVEDMVRRRLESVPTVEQLRSRFKPNELTEREGELKTFLDKRASELLAGLGDGARMRARDRAFRYVAQNIDSMSYSPCLEETGENCDAEGEKIPAGERLMDQQRKLDEMLDKKTKELGRDALISDLGPVVPRFPSKNKRRAAIRDLLGMKESNERTVRRLEKRKPAESIVERISMAVHRPADGTDD